jgi:hypothetical protein
MPSCSAAHSSTFGASRWGGVRKTLDLRNRNALHKSPQRSSAWCLAIVLNGRLVAVSRRTLFSATKSE